MARKNGHKALVVLHPGMSQDSAVRALVHRHAASFALQLTRLTERGALDATHLTRVALRRLRATLQAGGPRIDPKLYSALNRQLRALFQVIGGVRDAEVLAEQDSGTNTLRVDAALKRAALRKRLRADHIRRLPGEIAALFSGKSWRRSSKAARASRNNPVESLAVRSLDQAWAQVDAFGPSLYPLAPPVRHGLRKKIKALRYMAEDFAPLWPQGSATDFLAATRVLQEDLGLLNDMAMAAAQGLAVDASAADAALARAEGVWVGLRALPVWWHPAAPADASA